MGASGPQALYRVDSFMRGGTFSKVPQRGTFTKVSLEWNYIHNIYIYILYTHRYTICVYPFKCICTICISVLRCVHIFGVTLVVSHVL